MPMPVYFDVAGREANVTDDEARELAARLPAELELHRSIMARVGVSASSPVRLDVGGDEQRNLGALYQAIESLAEEGDLSPAIRTLRNRILAAMDAE
jgi:hypothetical protein